MEYFAGLDVSIDETAPRQPFFSSTLVTPACAKRA
jgi:hypothetical protein